METRSRFSSIQARGALVILSLAALAAAGCGVSKSKYLDITQQNEKLQQDLAQASKDKAQLESDKTALNGRVQAVEATNQQLDAKLREQEKATEEVKKNYESLAANLQGDVSSGQIQIRQLGDVISMSLAQDILFKSGSTEIDKTGKDLLMRIAEQLKPSPYEILVTGHSDDQKISPTLAKKYPTNWELAGARSAQIVRLFQQAGIPKSRLAAVSFSDSRPRGPNDTPENRAKNRRIEIRLRPMTSDQTAVGN